MQFFQFSFVFFSGKSKKSYFFSGFFHLFSPIFFIFSYILHILINFGRIFHVITNEIDCERPEINIHLQSITKHFKVNISKVKIG